MPLPPTNEIQLLQFYQHDQNARLEMYYQGQLTQAMQQVSQLQTALLIATVIILLLFIALFAVASKTFAQSTGDQTRFLLFTNFRRVPGFHWRFIFLPALAATPGFALIFIVFELAAQSPDFSHAQVFSIGFVAIGIYFFGFLGGCGIAFLSYIAKQMSGANLTESEETKG